MQGLSDLFLPKWAIAGEVNRAADIYNNHGAAKARLGERGLDDFDVIRIRPDFAEAYDNRGSVRVALGLTKEAIADL